MQISDEVLQQILMERERLKASPLSTDKATGAGIARFVVSCNDVVSVLGLAKEVMTIVNSYSTEGWPSIDKWINFLPDRFVNNCLPELTKEEKKRQSQDWNKLSYEEKINAASQEEKWTLSSWISWLEPCEREWFWWDAVLFDAPLSNSHFIIEVTSLDTSFMTGALKWLFKACGAENIISEDEL